MVLYLNSRPPNTTGTTGATAATCSNSCNIIPKGCSALNVLTVGYFGATGATGTICPSSCTSTINTVNVSGCLAPVCLSGFCTPQQALYTNVNSLSTFCSSGLDNPILITNPCSDPITGTFLASLGIQSSNIANNQLFPIYITTINGSIYGTDQPTAPSGIDQNTIKINNTDPTVIDNPYILYSNSSKFLSFQRINTIRNSLQNATWIYDPNFNKGNLILLNTVGAVNPTILNISVLNYYNSVFTDNYFGPEPPCGNSNLVILSPGVSELVYNANTGYFNAGQINNPQVGAPQLAYSNLILSPNPDSVLGTGFEVTAFPVPGIDYGGTCNFRDITRWYSISATNGYL